MAKAAILTPPCHIGGKPNGKKSNRSMKREKQKKQADIQYDIRIRLIQYFAKISKLKCDSCTVLRCN
jgi:hypothetical protein